MGFKHNVLNCRSYCLFLGLSSFDQIFLGKKICRTKDEKSLFGEATISLLLETIVQTGERIFKFEKQLLVMFNHREW